MGIPVIYRKTSEGVIPTYDFFDFVSSTGYHTFYATDLAASYAITSNNRTNATLGLTQSVSAIDITFFLEVQSLLVLKGKLQFSIPCSFVNRTGGGVTHNSDSTITLTWENEDGSKTETFGSVTQNHYNFSVGADYTFFACGEIDVNKRIKKGEYIKLRFQIGGAGANKYHVVFHEPGGRVLKYTHSGSLYNFSDFQSSVSKINFPLRVDL